MYVHAYTHQKKKPWKKTINHELIDSNQRDPKKVLQIQCTKMSIKTTRLRVLLSSITSASDPGCLHIKIGVVFENES